jgi:hypothetical protein
VSYTALYEYLLGSEREGREALSADPRVVTMTEDSAVLLYRAIAQRAGEEPYTAVMSSTFVREVGTWKLAFHQQSRPHPPEPGPH